MARVIPGAIISSITGSANGYNFSKYRGGHSLRRTPTLKKGCKSPAQQNARATLGQAAHTWSLLTATQRAKWEQYARSLKSTLPTYDKQTAGGSRQYVLAHTSWGIMSGYNAFIRCNMTARTAGWTALVTDAPINIPAPLPITGLYTTTSAPGYGVNAFWNNNAPFDTNTRITLIMSVPVSRIAPQVVQTLNAFANQGGAVYVTGTCGTLLTLATVRGSRLLITRRVSSEGQASGPGETVVTPGP